MPKMSMLLLRAIILSIVLTVVVSSAFVAVSTYHIVMDAYGSARIETLKQVAEANNTNQRNMRNLIAVVAEDVAPAIYAEDSEAIQQTLYEIQEQMQRFQLDYSIDVILRDKSTFSSVEGSEDRLHLLLNSYWYIKQLLSGDEISWNISYITPDDLTSYALTCSRAVRNRMGTVIGIVVLNATQNSLFSTYQEIVSTGKRVYILDETGVIISHSNQNMIGHWLKSMSAFEKSPGYNSYQISSVRGGKILTVNYRDPNSRWTFVEERDITDVLNNIANTIIIGVLVVWVGGAIAFLIALRRTRRVAKSLTAFTQSISALQPEHLEPLPENRNYVEIHVLGESFNNMILHIYKLIEDIRIREAEKRKTEYDFQQAQLSPHFLHNTLVAVKSLIYTRDYEAARKMLEEFVELLNIPSSSEIQYVTIDQEMHLIRNYISIMNCRTYKQVELWEEIPDDVRQLLIPRMLLQPIVGNAIFHGFADKSEDCHIRVTASRSNNLLQIVFKDNGEGIPAKRLREIQGNMYHSEGHHHGVGIRNIRKRLEYTYAGQSGVYVDSVYHSGTSVTVQIDLSGELPTEIT